MIYQMDFDQICVKLMHYLKVQSRCDSCSGEFLLKKFDSSNPFIYELILIQLHTNVKYDNILGTITFWHLRMKVKMSEIPFMDRF